MTDTATKPKARPAGFSAKLRSIAAAAFCCAATGGVVAQPIDTQRPQGEMLTRIEKAIDSYASRLNVPSSVVVYCRVQLQLDTRSAADGAIPFGVNYNTIATQEKLKNVIYVREAYETTYLKLCISRAKRDLDAAESP